MLDAPDASAYVSGLMGSRISALAFVLVCAACSSVDSGAHDRLFGTPDEGGSSSVGSGGTGSASGSGACTGQSCGGAACVNGEGPGCPAPTMTPPCATSQKECAGLCVQPGTDNGCGDTGCTPCPTVENAATACHGEVCGFDCEPGFVQNGNGCYPPPPACTDGAKNGTETDVDCGGDCPRCTGGKACEHGADCLSAACVNSLCATASCDNGVQDSTETDIDCGGSACPPCATGLRCRVGSDCSDGACTESSCRASSCADRTKNGSETSVDCGGSCAPCGLNAMCSVNADCASGHCVANVCRVPCGSPGQSGECPKCSTGTACCRSDDYCGCSIAATCNF